MPYTAEHKARTRARIVARARVLFNRRGFDEVSIDDIMKESGLTRGGFYNHFASKQALYADAINSFANCNPFAIESKRVGSWPSPQHAARRLAELYMSDDVLEDVDQHCPVIALPSDVARSGVKPRAAYTTIVQRMLTVFRAAFPANDPDAEAKAHVIVNLCVGSMVIARTTTDATLRRSLRAAALQQALTLLEATNHQPGRGVRKTRGERR